MTEESPSIDIDLFSDEAIADPYPRYAEIRDAGPIVWLPNYDMWAISRFDDVRAALRADSTLVSGHGVAMNDLLNPRCVVASLVAGAMIAASYEGSDDRGEPTSITARKPRSEALGRRRCRVFQAIRNETAERGRHACSGPQVTTGILLALPTWPVMPSVRGS